MYFNIDKKVKELTTDLNAQLESLAHKKYSVKKAGFFKTNENSYSAKDSFMGIKVPILRTQAEKFIKKIEKENLDFKKVEQILRVLLFSKWHEKRLFSLIVMVDIFKKNLKKVLKKNKTINPKYLNPVDAFETQPEFCDCQSLYDMYFKYISQVNNWDLVDLSASNIIGTWLYEKSCLTHDNKCIWYSDFDILNTLSSSSNIWERRISIVATHYFIKKNYTEKTFEIALLLLKDKEDLIHKASGWMLREAGKKDMPALKNFLRINYNNIPRTCLRYAIEKFDEPLRKKWLQGPINP